jgi:hypothetical protein
MYWDNKPSHKEIPHLLISISYGTYLLMSYQMMLLLAPDGTISELWMGQNVEGRGRGGQIRYNTPAVVWMDWGKPTQNLRHYKFDVILTVHRR